MQLLQSSRLRPDSAALGCLPRAQALTHVKRVPNFFIIGAPKCGTTSLCEYLRSHPNIYFSKVKEPQFFDLDCLNGSKIRLQTYLRLFSKVDPSIHHAVGEGSTGYLRSKVAVSEILKFNPNAQFIVILRKPIDLILSLHAQFYFSGVESVKDFEAAWRLEGERQCGRKIPRNCWEPKSLFYSECGKLGDQIERLYSVTDRNHVKAFIFEDFVANPKAIYDETLAFLGLQSDGRSNFPVFNESREPLFPPLQRTMVFSANCFRLLRFVSGWNLAFGLGWFQKLLFLNSKPGARRPISASLRSELNDYFREDVRKLSRLLGRDLSPWIEE
ncbi:MAG: sulfotransferase family protein [Limisphaerales bacterium]